MKKVGIFGGTFDPIHTGHLIMAQDAAEFARLDKILVMPSATPPLRDNAPIASGRDRLEMVKRAVAGNPCFEASALDLEANGMSYSIQVVEKIVARHPDDELFWILGADQIAQLDKWHRIDELSKYVKFIALKRPGYSLDSSTTPSSCRIDFAPTHEFDISASEIRKRLQSGLNVKYFLPPEVFEYIKAGSLYTRKTSSK